MKDLSLPSVAIIVLNWNSYADTFECLRSLGELNYPDFKVFLVDNDSKDDSYSRLIDDFNNSIFNLDIEFIQTGENLGFAGGNNAAIRRAYSEEYGYYWLLNNDTIVDKNALLQLVVGVKQKEDVGIVGSKIYYCGTDVIWFAGGRVNTWSGETRHIGLNEIDNGQFDTEMEVDYITGCSLLLKKQRLEDIGYMEEDYFLYYEETDWNIRAKSKGWRILYIPSSVIHHKVSKSSGGIENISPNKEYYKIRNRIIFIKRTQSLLKYIYSISYSMYRGIKSILGVLLKNKNRKAERIRLIFLGFSHACLNKMGPLRDK